MLPGELPKLNKQNNQLWSLIGKQLNIDLDWTIQYETALERTRKINKNLKKIYQALKIKPNKQ